MSETAGKPLAQRFWEAYDNDSLSWGDLRPEWQEKVEAGLQAVSAALRESGKPAKVIVVTEANGRERRYSASALDTLADGTLIIGDHASGGIDACAFYPPGHWLCAHKDSALDSDEMGHLQHRLGNVSADLGTALKALRGIRDGHHLYTDCPAGDTARTALDAIGYDDTEAGQ